MFISSLRLFVPFLSSIYDEVDNSFLIIEGDSDVELLDEGGYVMKDNQYLFKEDIDSSISNSFTFGFSLYPYCHGVVENPSDDSFENIKMPLFDFVDGSNSVLKFEEYTEDGCFNSLKIYIEDSFIIETPKYSASLWHHFWICYNGSDVEVYIDGVKVSYASEGALPSSISGNMLSLYINHSLSGYDYNFSKNMGYLGYLFLLNDFNNSKHDIQKSINRGVLYIVDNEYINEEMESLVVYFNDPNMVSVLSSVDDVSYVYIGRNDGKILRGSPLFWETRIRFSNKNEKQFFILNGEDTISNGFLKIKESIIRL